MDIQCPANIACLWPGQPVPTAIGGHRVVAVYLYDVESTDVELESPAFIAPDTRLWPSLQEIADAHRGEGVAVYAPKELLRRAWLDGVTLKMTSNGAERI